MSVRKGLIGVAAIAVVLIAFSCAGIISDYLADLKLDMDGLLLIACSGMTVVVFLAMLLALAKSEGWFGKGKSTDAAAAPSAATQK
jgi:hypothetical protein